VSIAPVESPARESSAATADRHHRVRLESIAIQDFRNLERVLVTVPAELEVASVVWARALLVSEAALPLVEARAQVRADT